MAAVIRYLSADNHTADTASPPPPSAAPETGPVHRARCEPIPWEPSFEPRECLSPVQSLLFVRIYLYLRAFTDITHRVSVQGNPAAALLFFLIYIYIAGTFTFWTIKTLFHAK